MTPQFKQYAKTPLLQQQVAARNAAAGRAAFALLMEQGTGKTLTLIDEALDLYANNHIDCLLVLAPNGVHESWALDEFPKHVADTTPIVIAYYVHPGNRRERAALDRVMQVHQAHEVRPLRVLAMSYDSLLTDRGFKTAEVFARSTRCMLVADESQRIKGKSQRTARALNLSKQCVVRRISTGTAVTNSPLDAFYQFEFLAPGLLGEETFAAFKRRYCELLPAGHGLMRHIVDRIEAKRGRELTPREREAVMPQVIATDEFGLPKYRNLDRLRAAISAHSYRVLKAECLDLPEKQFEVRYFHLTPAQRRVYDRMEKDLRYVLEDGTLLASERLVALGKLRQITSGFFMLRDGTISYIEDNPRIQLLASCLEEETQAGIIWSQYREEQRNIERMIRTELKQTVETVNGETPKTRRREIIQEFQAGNLQWISAHPATMGVGFTLTAAKLVYYYSNGFSLEERVQSEDRAHRIGQSDTVVYRDLVAIDTRDDDVVRSLRAKTDVAATVQGDSRRELRFADWKDELK